MVNHLAMLRRRCRQLVFLFVVLSVLSLPIKAQTAESKSSGSVLDRLLDIFELPLNTRATLRDSTRYATKLILAPVVYYTPETNWGGGVGAKLLFKLPGSGQETRTSNMPVSAIYTLNNQLVLYSGYTIFFNQEKYLLKGNLLYSKFPRLYFGIGHNTRENEKEEYAFNNLLIEPLLLRKVMKDLFIGGGIRYNRVYQVEVAPGGQLDKYPVSGTQGSTSLGVELAISYDSRDNVLNARKGMLVELTRGFYGKIANGSHQFTLTKLDIRQYLKPFPKRNDMLAFQVIGYFSGGNVPLMELAALGGNRMMRGYYEGRYRDRHLMAIQAEYRLELTPRLGFVTFGGLGTVASQLNDFQLSNLKPSLGAGVRFKINKEENLNIRLDYGIGRGTANYYFDIAEAF